MKKGYIKGIIGLPANLFYGTGIPAIIMVIDKENANVRKGIFMIDASKGFRKDGPKNRLRERDIHRIVNTFINFEEIPGYSRMVGIDEIERNEYNLNIPRYIEGLEQEDIQDIQAHLHGGIPARDVDGMEAWKVFKNLKDKLFGIKGNGYYELKIDFERLQEFVEQNEEVKGFKQRVMDGFEGWIRENFEVMRSLGPDTKPRSFIRAISESLLGHFGGVELIDEYAVYQILMDYWDEEMKDDVYMIVEGGWNARPYRVVEKNKKGKEVDKGWTCDLLPKEVVVDEFFVEEKEKIEDLEAQLEDVGQQIEQMLQEYGAEDGILDEVKNSKGKITKKDVKSKLKELKKSPEEYNEEIEILQRHMDLVNTEAKIKKRIKEMEKDLDESLLKKYAELTHEDVKGLVVHKKWLERIREGIEDEADNVLLNMVSRIKELARRYKDPLPVIEKEVEDYEKMVREHLRKMGFEV